MNKEDALKLALEALENGMKFVWADPEREAGFVAIDAIKEALAQPKKRPTTREEKIGCVQHDCAECVAREQREWVGLTDEERGSVLDSVPPDNMGGEYYDKEITAIAIAIEAKLKEKNT